jgi:hypothetical protein
VKNERRTQRRPAPEDILAGRARPSARELVTIIREVNPTGLELPAKETARKRLSDAFDRLRGARATIGGERGGLRRGAVPSRGCAR